jgi:hypothetical protein
MTTVKILVDAVGEYNEGDIVKDAPPSLVHMAQTGTRNVATNELVAIILDDPAESDSGLQSELESQVRGLINQLEVAEKRVAELEEQLNDGYLKDLKATAKELKIAGYNKMSADELKIAIAAGGVPIVE